MGKLLWTILFGGFFLAGLPYASPPVGPAFASAAESHGDVSPTALAALIDRRLEEKWHGVEPAPAADDAEFLRRVYLDLDGRIPRVNEVRDFLEDPAPDRRERVVERLLDSPQYVSHFSNAWWKLLVPSADNQQFAGQASFFKTWLQEQVRDNTHYDKIVRDLLTASLANSTRTLDRYLPPEEPSPVGFLLANELKPDNLAASTSRIFMGVRLECAQCHDHPFARWSRAQFWEMAAFFTSRRANPSPNGTEVLGSPPPLPPTLPQEVTLPGTDKVVRAKFLDGTDPNRADAAEPRATLAKWLTATDNPYFAPTAVNRIWAHFFGIGLTDPVDDEPTAENPVRHPELLAELSAQFVAHDYDIKYLIRTVTATRAYQRTSAQSHSSQADPRAFARMAVRGLTPEQVFDSVALAVGFKENAANPARPGNLNSSREDFLNRFAGQERAVDKQTSILQALALMNGKFVAAATSLDRSTTLAAVADVPFMTAPQKIETLYLAALSRLPRPEEAQRLGAYVSAGGPRGDPRQALSDVFWALLNSAEFILNH
jgi:hypothetical protein